MRCFALYLGFSFSTFALADKRSRTNVKRNSTQQEAPGMVPGDGSLWDFIDAPAETTALSRIPADAADIESNLGDPATGTPNEMDGIEPSWAVHGRPDVDFYIQPLKVLEIDPLHIAEINSADFDIPIVINDDVKRWMNYYIGKGRKNYTKWLERKGAYEALFLGYLTDAQLPTDLMYLSMIESGYKTHAYSHASAAGLWQFISPTAKEWGLRVDWWVDERRSPEDATKAATNSWDTSTRNMVIGTSRGRPIMVVLAESIARLRRMEPKTSGHWWKGTPFPPRPTITSPNSSLRPL